MSDTEISTIVTDPFHNCDDEEEKTECLADTQKVRDNDPNYTELSWTGRYVGADGAKVLAKALGKNSSVTYIDLGDNGIGDDGVKAIAEALKKNSSVTTIRASYNNIGADGAKAIAEALAENSSVTKIRLYDNNISPTNETLIKSKAASNAVLKKHQDDVRKNNDNTKPLSSLSYYVDEISATSSLSLHDNKPQWKWTSAAWEAVNDGDGRVAQVLLDCLKEDTNNNSDFRESLKKLVETDFHKEHKQSMLHIAASKSYSKVFDLLKFFVEDCKVKIDLADEEGRSIREIAIGNQNSDISAWARKFGTYLNRYRIEGGSGLDSDPVHQSETCTVHFATDMDQKQKRQKLNHFPK